jgi:hypothetical protein
VSPTAASAPTGFSSGPCHLRDVLNAYVRHYVRHEASLDRVEVKGLRQRAVAAARQKLGAA